MSRDHRLDKLYPAFTAKERALLVLRQWKAGQEVERGLISSMPEGQYAEYNRYLGLMQAASGDLTHNVVILSQMVEQLDLRFAWLQTLHLWALSADLVLGELTRLLKEGTPAAGAQKERDSASCPRLQIFDELRRAPLSLVLGTAGGSPRGEEHICDDEDRPADEVAAALIDRLRTATAMRWQELRSAETVLQEAAAELDGEDLLHPKVRVLLDEGLEKVRALHAGLQAYGGEFELGEPETELLGEVRLLMQRASER